MPRRRFFLPAAVLSPLMHVPNTRDLQFFVCLFEGLTTVGVRQRCLLSSPVFSICLERITTDALEDHEGTVSIGGRTITNPRFADDTDGLAGEEEELAKLVERPEKASTA